MKFLDYKKFLEENKEFYVYKLVVVSEVEYFRDLNNLTFTDDEFTRVCQFVYDWIQNTEATAAEVARIVCDGLCDESITITDMDDYSNGYSSVAEDWLNNQF